MVGNNIINVQIGITIDDNIENKIYEDILAIFMIARIRNNYGNTITATLNLILLQAQMTAATVMTNKEM